ncbi:HNH endonuclease [Bacillus sp. OTU530]|uniref:HNH endonuclease n=1 Tax=Bacillus sp. OTU530 TaxID=3043862 RepID=UPI00313B3013
MQKICTQCKEKKEISAFCINKSRKDGYNSACKECINKKRRKTPLPKVFPTPKDGYKSCTDCEEEKPLDAFVKDKGKSDGVRNRCQKCENLKRRKTPIPPNPKDGYKFCAKCKEEKLLTEFNTRFLTNIRKYKPFSYCKPCEHKLNNNRYEHNCEICGKEYKSGKRDSKVCSECHTKHILLPNSPIVKGELDFSGENNPMFGVHRFGRENPNYNPNKTDEEREIGRLLEGYGTWREMVFKRDNYTCQCCGDNKGGNLHAHHLDGYNWCKEKRTDVNNGVTLCNDCHTKFHKIYGLGNNTKQQFLEFMKKEHLA